LQQVPITLLHKDGQVYSLQDHFLWRFADAYIAEIQDFIQNLWNDKAPRVSGEDGLRALEISVAAESSYLQSRPYSIARHSR
jgi:predicted dehydrogenase